MNVRFSNTLKSERLTDAQCVNGLQTGITKAGFEMITAARYIKGYGMLERYEGKLSRTVLRRGKASNRFSLFSKPRPPSSLRTLVGQSCALCLASPDCSSQPPFVNLPAFVAMLEGWCGCVGGFEGGRRDWGCGCFTGTAADFLIIARYIKQWTTEKRYPKIRGMDNMGFELSRLQIMEVSGKRYVQALDICPEYAE